MCQHGSEFVLFFIARGLGSKYSAVSSISICDDRVDMNWVCTKAWAQPILQHAVHRIQGAKINYRSLEKNNNPPLLFPSSRLFLFTAQEHPEEPIGHTVGSAVTPTLRVPLSPCLKPAAHTVPPIFEHRLLFCFCLQKHYLLTRGCKKTASDFISFCRRSRRNSNY